MTKVWKVGNQLRIKGVGKTMYGNASLYELLYFREGMGVELIYHGEAVPKYINIPFSEFTDSSGVIYSTE